MTAKMHDEFVKDIWRRRLSYAMHKISKGRSAFPAILDALNKALRDGERLALARGLQIPDSVVLEPGEIAEASQERVVDAITEAQIALAAGDLKRFGLQIHRGIALIRELQERKPVNFNV